MLHDITCKFGLDVYEAQGLFACFKAYLSALKFAYHDVVIIVIDMYSSTSTTYRLQKLPSCLQYCGCNKTRAWSNLE
jgi:hypothetical protein